METFSTKFKHKMKHSSRLISWQDQHYQKLFISMARNEGIHRTASYIHREISDWVFCWVIAILLETRQ